MSLEKVYDGKGNEHTLCECADSPSTAGSNVAVAHFEVVETDTRYGAVCLTHTASDIRQLLGDNIPIIATICDPNTQSEETVTVSYRNSGSEIIVGCSVADGVWCHNDQYESCYLDGNRANKVCGNEVWGEY